MSDISFVNHHARYRMWRTRHDTFIIPYLFHSFNLLDNISSSSNTHNWSQNLILKMFRAKLGKLNRSYNLSLICINLNSCPEVILSKYCDSLSNSLWLRVTPRVSRAWDGGWLSLLSWPSFLYKPRSMVQPRRWLMLPELLNKTLDVKLI